MNLLIIDDDAVDRMSALRSVKESGLQLTQVDQTASAQEGIEIATTRAYDAILLDYQLPPSNGIEVLRELRGSNNFSTAIVMLSHSNDEELALKCIEAGAQDFVMKSEITANRLKRAILLAAERHQLEQQVRASHDQLRILAEQDSLTGLSNRYFFDEALKDAISQSARDNKSIALLLLDLDKFKNINDTLGHAVGDLFLQEVARRLEQPVREGDKLCRLGGDEFAVLVHNLDHPNHIRLLVQRIFESIAKPVEIQDQTIQISASIGVATFPGCARDAEELMKCADVAMYRAKELGRNQAQYYARDFHHQIESRIRIENDLRKALSKNQFVLHFQPQIDSSTHELRGIEALIRWQHPEMGLLPPNEFIPIAEESHSINDIGRWVLESACQQFNQWLKLRRGSSITFSIAANLSARQLVDSGLADHLLSCLERYQIPPGRFELELTESSLENSLAALDMLKKLSDLGVNLALDDFGTGYSSLSHLKQYPFNILKIDKTFVQDTTNEDNSSLLRAICSFAHTLGYKTVAEGVETEAQRDLCAKLGVNLLQGFLFSRPLPADQFEQDWIK